MRPLGIDCLTLPDVGPVDLVRIAGATGYSMISLWVQPPPIFEAMLAASQIRADISMALDDHGITLHNLEVFNLNFEGSVLKYEAALELGASLGARSASVIHTAPAREDTAERLAAFHELAQGFGIRTHLEPISVGLTKTLRQGVELIEAAGIDGKLVVDFLHLIRTGGSVDSLASIDPQRIGYVQICDGPLRPAEDQVKTEARANRLYPGDGEFPLVDLMRLIPEDVPLAVEAPSEVRERRGVSPVARAREAAAATRRVLQSVT